MVFEGSEKIIELGIKSGSPSLRELSYDFWQRVVASAGADIISHISNEDCDAYLLSESSLFVWPNRIRMLTCGATQLSNALVMLVEILGVDKIEYSTYQRKNEYQLQSEIRSFEQDLVQIKSVIPGKGYRIGHLDSHHHYLFMAETGQLLRPLKITELLMYHLTGELAQYFRSAMQTKSEIRRVLGLEAHFIGFKFDDHLFEPCGYSLNGIKGDKYLTIHITPQEKSSYCSIETNLDHEVLTSALLHQFVLQLKPERYDLIAFGCPLLEMEWVNELNTHSCSINTENGYDVHFKHIHQQHDLPFTEVL